MTSTELNVAGVVFREPVTALTDFLLVVMCLYFVTKLNTVASGQPLRQAWEKFYLIFALSVFIGGLAHLFRYYLEGKAHQALWMTMNLLSAVAVYYAELTALITLSPDKQQNKKYQLLFLALMSIFMGLSLIFWDYKFVKINSGIGLTYMLVCNLVSHYKYKRAGAFTIATGIFISFLTLIVHGFKLSFCEWFNFNDISHVIMMASLYFMFKGAREMLNTSSI